MSAIAASTLLSEANCFNCFGAMSQAQMMKLSLLARILKAFNPVAATDPQSLVAYANCFNCASSASFTELMELALIDQIFQALGAISAGTQQVYIGRDPAAPDNPALPAISYPSGGGTTTQWDVASQTWK